MHAYTAGGASTAANGQQQQQQQRSRCLIYLNDIEACAQCVQRLKTELAKEVAEGFEVRMCTWHFQPVALV
jgi:hypothetical protein